MTKHAKKQLGAIVHKTGVKFGVWAPFAKGVSVTGSFNDWQKTPMEPDGEGRWFVDVKDAKAGQEYKFAIQTETDELYRNDPRSLAMTTVAGNSVIVDTDFDWEDDDFTPPPFNEQVIYEMHLGTFYRDDPAVVGSFQTAMEKLSHLHELGVNMIELMPINTMAMDRGWGYASDYIYSVESLYGGRHGLLEFVKAAHKLGIGVILDVVYNHIGPDEELDLWQFDGWSENNKGGIYFYNDWRSETPWGDTRPDYGRPEVRQYILDNVLMWLEECRLDGLRLDSTVYLRNVRGYNNDPDHDIPEAWLLLQDVNDLAKKVNPKAIMIGEDIAYNEYITRPHSEGGAGFDAQWEVTFPQILRNALEVVNDSDRNLTDICSALEKRYNGQSFQRVIYSDSHDSAANGAARLSEEISPGNPSSVFARKRSLLASAIVLTAPGIPMLFQGQEFMQGGSFNDWETLDWDKAEQFDGIVLATKHLIALRKNQHGNTGGLCGPSVRIMHLNEDSKVLAYHRWGVGGPGDDVMVIINLANTKHNDYWLNFPRHGVWTARFCSDWEGYDPDFKNITTEQVHVEGEGGSLPLAPYSVTILSQDS